METQRGEVTFSNLWNLKVSDLGCPDSMLGIFHRDTWLSGLASRSIHIHPKTQHNDPIFSGHASLTAREMLLEISFFQHVPI
jgi:hypothetical protein